MDSQRFDVLTKRLAAGASRRSVVKALLGSALGVTAIRVLAPTASAACFGVCGECGTEEFGCCEGNTCERELCRALAGSACNESDDCISGLLCLGPGSTECNIVNGVSEAGSCFCAAPTCETTGCSEPCEFCSEQSGACETKCENELVCCGEQPYDSCQECCGDADCGACHVCLDNTCYFDCREGTDCCDGSQTCLPQSGTCVDACQSDEDCIAQSGLGVAVICCAGECVLDECCDTADIEHCDEVEFCRELVCVPCTETGDVCDPQEGDACCGVSACVDDGAGGSICCAPLNGSCAGGIPCCAGACVEDLCTESGTQVPTEQPTQQPTAAPTTAPTAAPTATGGTTTLPSTGAGDEPTSSAWILGAAAIAGGAAILGGKKLNAGSSDTGE